MDFSYKFKQPTTISIILFCNKITTNKVNLDLVKFLHFIFIAFFIPSYFWWN